MNFVDERAVRLGFWLTVLGSVFAWAPATYPGYWQSLDGFVPLWNAPHSSLVATVATAPDLWRGTGRAAFLLAQPLLLLGATPATAVRVTFILAIVLGGLGVYAWLRPRLGDRGAGLAALVYLSAPILLNTVYVRGSLADALILTLLPVTLAGLAGYAESRAPSAAAVVVLALLWMWRIQAGLALFATLLLLLYALWVERTRLGALVVAVSAAAGVVSLAPLWQVAAPPAVVLNDHFVRPVQLLFRLSAEPLAPLDRSRGMPVELGFAVLVFGLAALWLWSRRGARPSDDLGRLLGFSVGLAVLAGALTLGVSAPLWMWSGADRLLTYPWQLLIVIAPLTAALAGSLPALSKPLARAPLWLSLAALVILSSAPYRLPDYTQTTPLRLPAAVFGSRPDLAVVQASLIEERDRGEARLEIVWQVLHRPEFDYNLFFQAVTPLADGDVAVVAQLDTQPRQGLQPATTWVPGTVMTDTLQLDLPTGSDALRYYFGFYDWRDGTRLPVDGGIDDKMILYGN